MAIFNEGFLGLFQDHLLDILPDCGVLEVDHVVGNQPEHQMEEVARW